MISSAFWKLHWVFLKNDCRLWTKTKQICCLAEQHIYSNASEDKKWSFSAGQSRTHWPEYELEITWICGQRCVIDIHKITKVLGQFMAQTGLEITYNLLCNCFYLTFSALTCILGPAVQLYVREPKVITKFFCSCDMHANVTWGTLICASTPDIFSVSREKYRIWQIEPLLLKTLFWKSICLFHLAVYKFPKPDVLSSRWKMLQNMRMVFYSLGCKTFIRARNLWSSLFTKPSTISCAFRNCSVC